MNKRGLRRFQRPQAPSQILSKDTHILQLITRVVSAFVAPAKVSERSGHALAAITIAR
jgi:hypothetical protein